MPDTKKTKRLLVAAVVIAAALAACYAVYRMTSHVKAKEALEFQYTFEKQDSGQSGYILLAPYVPVSESFSRLVIIDNNGKLVMQKRVEGIVGDFRQWVLDGRIRYTYTVYDPAVFLQSYAHGSVAQVMVLDDALNKIKEVKLLSHKDVVVKQYEGIDHHDLIMLSDDHYIVMASYVKEVSNIPDSINHVAKVRVATPVIQEVNNGKVVWQWVAADHPEFYGASTKGNKFSDSVGVQDYMHINSMVIDPRDSNIIVSFHNTNQVIKIDRHGDSILWRLGGKNSDFDLSKEQTFMRQHNATLIDSAQTLLLFDNGDSTIRPYSRVVEFRLDEQRKTVTAFKVNTITDRFAESKGSVQLAGDDYLICSGSANYVLRVSRKTGAKKAELRYNHTSFRAYWVNDVSGIKAAK